MNKKVDLESIYSECIKYANKIKNSILKEVCIKILKDYKIKLISKPATTGSHHYFKGGLLHHTYCVTRNAVTICELYSDLKVDRDLIIFGSLLHDIGKAEDYSDWSDESGSKHISNNHTMLGHSYRGAYIVENYLSEYEIDIEFKNQVLHMIGSHMIDFSDYGTLVLPKMLEVLIINYGDNMDAHLEPAHSILLRANKGDSYKIGNAPNNYYKSLNPYYNKN